MLDAHCSTEDVKVKVHALRDKAITFFEQILHEGLRNLKEDYESCEILSPVMMETLDFLKQSENTELAVREFFACARLRQGMNSSSHPFSPIASKAVRESATALYSSLLWSESTKVFLFQVFYLSSLYCSNENIHVSKINRLMECCDFFCQQDF